MGTLLSVFAVAAPVLAQDARPAADLQEVLSLTLQYSPRLESARRALDRARGVWQQSGAPFDPLVRSSVTSQREQTLLPPAVGASAASYLGVDGLEYRVEGEKLLRSGISIRPVVQVSQSRTTGVGTAPSGVATAALQVAVPLLNDRGGRVTGAPERAAELALQASGHDLRFVASTVIRDAVTVWWTYMAARDRLVIQLEAETRAQRMTLETQRLVAADERPAADMRQVEANVASKRAARIQAEQRVLEAQRDLALAVGVDPERLTAAFDATSTFPTIDFGPDTSGATARYLALADSAREDVHALRRLSDASRVEADGVTGSLKPRADLALSAGYDGYAARWGVPGLVRPFVQNTSGLKGAVQLSYQWPVLNVGARGRLAQAEAIVRQQDVQLAEARRRAHASVRVAWSAVRASRASLQEASRSVSLYEETVENEMTKFRLGTSTLFDIINAEDALTAARLAAVSSQQAHAQAVVDLRFATGTLVSVDHDAVRAPASRPLTLPN
ncbi:MAG: TolC family protein [Gemmatimonadaceae bacterium]|nr:TolC family protein [Gemmatimonadaceae bacterium]